MGSVVVGPIIGCFMGTAVAPSWTPACAGVTDGEGTAASTGQCKITGSGGAACVMLWDIRQHAHLHKHCHAREGAASI